MNLGQLKAPPPQPVLGGLRSGASIPGSASATTEKSRSAPDKRIIFFGCSISPEQILGRAYTAKGEIRRWAEMVRRQGIQSGPPRQSASFSQSSLVQPLKRTAWHKGENEEAAFVLLHIRSGVCPCANKRVHGRLRTGRILSPLRPSASSNGGHGRRTAYEAKQCVRFGCLAITRLTFITEEQKGKGCRTFLNPARQWWGNGLLE